MCFNKETSFLSFFFSLALAIKMFLIGDNIIGTLLVMLSLVQLNEFFLWIYLKNKDVNYYLTLGMAIILLFQPVMVSIVATPELIKDHRKTVFYIWEVLLIFFFGLILFLIYKYNSSPKYDMLTTTSDKTCRLLWGFNNGTPVDYWKNILILLTYIIVFFLIFQDTGNMDLFYVMILGLLIAFAYNWIYGEKIGQGYGSMWCFIGNLMIAFILMTRLIGKTSKELT